MTARYNGLFYAGRGDHVESWFVKAVAPDARRAVWLKATVLANGRQPQDAVAEGWGIACDRRAKPVHVAVKQSVSFSRARFHAERLAISWDDGSSSLSMIETPAAGVELHTGGVLTSSGQRVAWELCFSGDGRPLEVLPFPWMYRTRLPASKAVTPLPDARVDGWVEVAGARWELLGWRGMQGHNWQRAHGEYAWMHCNAFDVPDLVVEAVSAKLAIGPARTPYVTSVVVRHRGVDHRFVVPQSLWSADCDVQLRSYAFSAEGPAGRVSGLVEADEFVGLRYHNPGGSMISCLNDKLARVRLRFEPAGGGTVEATSRARALEIGTQRADHGVTLRV